MTLMASFMPSLAPEQAASIPLMVSRSILAVEPAAVSLTCVSGMMILEMSRAAGALITLAVNR